MIRLSRPELGIFKKYYKERQYMGDFEFNLR